MAKYTIRHDKNEVKSIIAGDGKFALGITIGALSVILALVVLESLGPEKDPNYLTVAPLIISLLVAAASTFFAARALLEQRRTREAGTDPVLIAHLGQRVDAQELITFNMTNIGAGAAINVRLNVEKPNESETDFKNRRILQNIFIKHHTISVILQGQSIEFSLGLGWDLLGAGEADRSGSSSPPHPLPPFRAWLAYEDLSGGEYESEFTIDVLEMMGRGANKSTTIRMVNALETIAKKYN